MLKRWIALLMCVVLMLASLPVSALAASEEEHQRIRDQISDVYRRTLSATGTSSLHGYCGMMAGWELYLMGITTSAVTHNGNDMYDVLKDSDQIAEGYTPVCYSAADYSLEEALNAVSNFGSKDVYNMIIGFQWTTTAAGRLYGHVTVVHAILDGMVYFTEGFVTPFQSDPSQAMVCTIHEFAEHYNGWAGFEGLIHFNSGIAVAGCESVACDLFVAAETEITLLSAPDFMTAEEMRTVPAGERLYASALCRNLEGVLFYQIKEESGYSYISAGQVTPVWFHGTQVSLHDACLPEQVKQGMNSRIAGTIRSDILAVRTVAVNIADQNGESVLYQELPTEGTKIDLRIVDEAVDLSKLPEGAYTMQLYCDMENPYYANGEILYHIRRVMAAEVSFGIGSVTAEPKTSAVISRAVQNGWLYENEKWYYYENDIVRTGWFCDNGVDYYLQSDGSAATGWQEINGKNRYFSQTGAMRTGWLETADGMCYLLSNGAKATGLIKIGDTQYFFDADGWMVTQSAVEFKGQTYHVNDTGIAVLAPETK